MSGAGMSSCGPMIGSSSEREAARHPLQLVERELARVAADAALGAAVREPQQRALPGHPHRERRALAERHLVVVADAALRRPEHGRVLDAVAREDRPAARVELDRDADDERALRVAEPLGDELLDVRVRERLLVLRQRRPVERRLPLQVPVPGRNLLHLGHARSLVPLWRITRSVSCRNGSRPSPPQPTCAAAARGRDRRSQPNEVVMVPAKPAPDFVRRDAGEGTRTLMPAEADT